MSGRTWIQLIILVCVMTLDAESLRIANKDYFDSIQWETLDDLAIPPLFEPHAMDVTNPVYYGDMMLESGIYPSVDMLGILDYQNLSEDILSFYDTVGIGFVKKELPADMFISEKSFLPHFTAFLMQDIPAVKNAFYSRPTVKYNGTVYADFKLVLNNRYRHEIPKQAVQAAFDEDLPAVLIIAVTGVKREKKWYISALDVKETIYEDTSNAH